MTGNPEAILQYDGVFSERGEVSNLHTDPNTYPTVKELR